MSFEQPELALEWPVYHSYKIELRKGPSRETISEIEVTDLLEAKIFIEATREFTCQHDEVVWRDPQVDYKGDMVGLAPGGVIWQIHVTPPLTQKLSV